MARASNVRQSVDLFQPVMDLSNRCVDAIAAVGSANLAAIHACTSNEVGYRDPDPERDHVTNWAARIEQLFQEFPDYPNSDPFLGDNLTTLAGVEGTSAHAIFHKMLARSYGLICLARNDRLPLMPPRFNVLPGMLSYSNPEVAGVINYTSGLGSERDRLVVMLRALFVRWRGLETTTGMPHALQVLNDFHTKLENLRHCELNRAAQKLQNSTHSPAQAIPRSSPGKPRLALTPEQRLAVEIKRQSPKIRMKDLITKVREEYPNAESGHIKKGVEREQKRERRKKAG